MAQANHLVARQLQEQIALAVLIEGDASAVAAVAIGLDDQPLRWPQEIDLVLANLGAYDRPGKAVTTAESKEVGFEIVGGAIASDPLHRKPQELRLAKRAPKLIGRGGAPEVHEYWRRCCHGDLKANGGVAGEEGCGSMGHDASTPPAAAARHADARKAAERL